MRSPRDLIGRTQGGIPYDPLASAGYPAGSADIRASIMLGGDSLDALIQDLGRAGVLVGETQHLLRRSVWLLATISPLFIALLRLVLRLSLV